MPDSYVDDHGVRFVWDPTSQSYVRADDAPHELEHPTRWVSDTFDTARDTMLPQNPLGEGILAAKAEDEDEEERRHDWDDVIPDVDHPDGMPSKQPRQNFERTDVSFPSKISVDLGSCPDCHGHLMFDDGDERACAACGTRQPVLKLTNKRPKMAPLALLAEGLPELAGAGAEGAAAEGGAAESGGGGNLLGSAGKLMNAAQGAHAFANPVKDAVSAPDKLMDSNQVAPDPTYARVAADTADMYADEQDKGKDDEPGGEETQGFAQAVGDSPDLLKDVTPGGHSNTVDEDDEDNGHLSYYDTSRMRLGLSLDLPGAEHSALETFQHSLPLVLFYATSDKDGSTNPVIQALDEMLEGEHPGYKESDLDDGGLVEQLISAFGGKSDKKPEAKKDTDDSDSDNDSDDDHEWDDAGVDSDTDTKESSVQHEARMPNMCPYHKDLVGYSRELGDPAAALQALPASSYGNAFCNDGGYEGRKCNFRPAMVTERYWENAAAQAEERAQQRREQEQAAPVEQPVDDGLDFVPADTATDYTLDEQPATLVPADAPSAVGGLEVAASVDGKPLEAGRDYLMKAAGFEPEQVRVEKVEGSKITFVSHVDGLSFRDQIDATQAQFKTANDFGQMSPWGAPAQAAPSAPNTPTCMHGMHPDTCPECQKERMQAENNPLGQQVPTPLPGQAPMLASASVPDEHLTLPMSHEAGYPYSTTEQLEFVNEPGVARNLSRLQIDDVPHYAGLLDEDLIQNSFIF